MRVYPRFIWSSLAVIFGINLSVANSQNTTDDRGTPLDPITVSGSGLNQRLSETFSNISIFNKKEIENSGLKSLADFLQGRSSVEVGRNGGLGGVTSFFLRGSESRNVLVLLNGVRLRDELTQSSLAENIPLDLVEKIEVIPGNMSSVYGEGAIGGVIKIITKEVNQDQSQRDNKSIRVESGNYGIKNLSFTIESALDDSLLALVSGNVLQTDGFSSTNPAETFSSDDTDFDNDKYKNKTINLNLSKQLRNSFASLTYFRTDSEAYFDNSFFGRNPKQHSDQEQLNFTYDFDLTSDNNVKVTYDNSKIKLRYSYGQFFETKEDKIAVQNDIRLSNDDNFLFGLEQRSISRNPSSSGVKRRDFKSAFVAFVGDRGPFSLQVNLRSDNTNRFKSRVTYLTGIGYLFAPRHSLYFNHSTGFISPNTYALSTNAGVLPEKHKQFEAGYTFLRNSLIFRLTYFDTKTSNPITYDPSDGYKAKNLSRFQNSGYEISLKNVTEKKIFDISLTFQNPQSPDGLNPSSLIQSARRANFFGSFGFTVNGDKFDFSIRGTSSSARKDSDYSSQMLSKYFIINGSLKYKIRRGLNIFGTVQNLANKNYQLAYGYNTIPQQFTIGVSSTF